MRSARALSVASSRHRNLDSRGVPKLGKKLLAIGPLQAKGSHVCCSEPRDYSRQYGITLRKHAVHQGRLGPINQLLEGQLVPQPSLKLSSNDLTADHSSWLSIDLWPRSFGYL